MCNYIFKKFELYVFSYLTENNYFTAVSSDDFKYKFPSYLITDRSKKKTICVVCSTTANTRRFYHTVNGGFKCQKISQSSNTNILMENLVSHLNSINYKQSFNILVNLDPDM